ncbi:alpha/beta fold hydrolase [Lysinibacillus sp. LZ02]|uniref:alpha/beta fold hydrolase n=1 Tax=Lysinibacillus sp. LZ02 TaxID=3420668 RepID=UPI003D35A508
MLHYELKGSGDETLVIVHGFLGDITIFNKVMEELQQHYELILIDLPGHGKSKMEQENYTIYDYAQAIVNVLAQEKIANAAWLGHSMGGYIALATLERNMAKIDKLILAYSSASPDSAETQNKRDEQMKTIEQNGVKAFVDNSIDAFFSKEAANESIEFARTIAYKATEEGLIAALQAMKERPNQTQLLHETSTPILVIEGQQDTIVSPIETDNIAVQKIVTNTGHIGMLEDDKAFLKAIKQFLG